MTMTQIDSGMIVESYSTGAKTDLINHHLDIPLGDGVEYANPIGDKLAELRFPNQVIEVLLPKIPDMPLNTGMQVQIVDRTLNVANLNELPLLSEGLDLNKYLRLEAVAAMVAQKIFESSKEPVWININTQTSPLVTPETPGESRPYHCLTVDIHIRHLPKYEEMFDFHGEIRPEIVVDDLGALVMGPDAFLEPPPLTGYFGIPSAEAGVRMDLAAGNEPATIEEIRQYAKDPADEALQLMLRLDSIRTGISHWKNSPTGTTPFFGRRIYEPTEISEIRQIFAQWDIQKEAFDKLESTSLFSDEAINHPPYPAEWTHDIELWRSGKADAAGRYRIVTQKNPLVDPKDGMHFVVELSPETHTAWENLEVYLSMRAISIGMLRILNRNDLVISTEGGQSQRHFILNNAFAYINGNWNFKDIAQIWGDNPSKAELRKRLMDRARTHMHIIVSDTDPETPPMRGTFKDHRKLNDKIIATLKTMLNDPKNGLSSMMSQILNHNLLQ
jgi:hypothetical protein